METAEGSFLESLSQWQRLSWHPYILELTDIHLPKQSPVLLLGSFSYMSSCLHYCVCVWDSMLLCSLCLCVVWISWSRPRGLVLSISHVKDCFVSQQSPGMPLGMLILLKAWKPGLFCCFSGRLCVCFVWRCVVQGPGSFIDGLHTLPMGPPHSSVVNRPIECFSRMSLLVI